ncbi:MAG: DUF1501 domain-containing protein [Planctomycetaceae bacterium]
MLFNRREFLRSGVAFGAVVALPRATWAGGAGKEPGSRTLVLLHLNGGNDGLNTVIPHADPRYRALRPGIGIDATQVRKLDASLGLHPALAGFEQLWRKERLAIVNGVGYPQPDYSHFRATEIYYTAEPEKSPTYGWLGRALDLHPAAKPLRAVALGREKPLCLACATPGVVTLGDFAEFRVPSEAGKTRELYEAYAALGGEREAVARRTLEALEVAGRIAALRPAGGPFGGPLGDGLRKALALLQSDLDLEYIHLSFGGFDTHAGQAGAHNGLLQQVGNNLAAFQDQIDAAGLGDRVATFVFSEFGRRPEENLSGGTDHGSAYPAFVIGKCVRPGFHGSHPSLEDFDGGNFRFTTDFRRLYAGILRGFLGLDPAPVVGDHAPLELFA